MRMTSDGSRTIGFGVALAALLGGLSGCAWWYWATFSFDPVMYREMRLSAAIGLGIVAFAVAVLGVLVWHQLGAPRWSLAAVGVVATLMTAWTLHELLAARDAPTSEFESVTTSELWLLVVLPTSWPLMLLGLRAAVRLLRGWWSPSPRSRPAR